MFVIFIISIYIYISNTWDIIYYRFFYNIDLSNTITYDPDASIIDSDYIYVKIENNTS